MVAWGSLALNLHDSLFALGLILPLFVVGAFVSRGFQTYPLVTALMWRFRWANVLFVLLIATSVGMSVALTSQERGLRIGTAKAAEKFDLLVTAPGNEVTMMLASVFLQPADVPLLDGETYAAIANHPSVNFAAPLAFGDSFDNAPVVGTSAAFARHLTDGQIDGRLWKTAQEGVVGAFLPLAIGQQFEPAHGVGEAAEAGAHAGSKITVVGRMAPTGSPWDRSILVPVESVWQVHGLADGHAPENAGRIGPPFDAAYFPGTPAIIVHTEELWSSYALRSEFTSEGETMAFFPGAVLANLYRIMGDVRQAMSLMSMVTQTLVAASVLLGLFILTRLFQRQLAMLRALGAPARFVLAVVWLYGVILIATGTLLGLLFGLIAAGVLSQIVTAWTAISVTNGLGWSEIHLAIGFVTIISIFSLLPAVIATRKSIVDGLRS